MSMDVGQAGDSVALLLEGVKPKEMARGMVLAQPGTLTAYTRFSARMELLTAKQGGRNHPIFSGFQPQFHVRTAEVTGTITIPGGRAELGESFDATVKLGKPLSLQVGAGFVLREGGRTIGSGVVTAVSA